HNVGEFGARHRLQEADGKSAARFAGEFSRAEDGGLLRLSNVGSSGVGCNFGSPANASRIEEDFVGTLVDGKLEQAAVLPEERAPLLEGRFKSRNVDLGGVGLDLAEVGVQREVQSQPAIQSKL